MLITYILQMNWLNFRLSKQCRPCLYISEKNSMAHTGYPETTNATDNKKRSWNQQAGIGGTCLSGNNLPRIKLIRGKLFLDRYLLPMTA